MAARTLSRLLSQSRSLSSGAASLLPSLAGSSLSLSTTSIHSLFSLFICIYSIYAISLTCIVSIAVATVSGMFISNALVKQKTLDNLEFWTLNCFLVCVPQPLNV